MKKYSILSIKLALLVIIFSSIQFAFSQKIETKGKSKRPFKERISVGGSLGLGFGSNSILVEVSPIFGYSLTNNLVVGLGLTYKYYQYNDFYRSTADPLSFIDLKNNIYGGSIFARYFLSSIGIPVIENMFIHTEVEPLIFTSDFKYISNQYGDYYGADGAFYIKEKEQVTITSYFLGGGLRQPVTDRSYLYIEVLWNFNEELYTPYSNPRIRIGFSAGF
jgi:hypothetical protein